MHESRIFADGSGLSGSHRERRRFAGFREVLAGAVHMDAGLVEQVDGVPGFVRVLDYAPESDGVVFLRAKHDFAEALLEQWDALEGLVCDRPLLPRLVIVAGGFSGELALQERTDLSLLLESARDSWCRWIAAANLERFCEKGHAELINLFGCLGTQVYISDEYWANPLPAICERCASARADVGLVGGTCLCADCRASADPEALLAYLGSDVAMRERMRASCPDDAF